jgi:hypothetical protein
MQNVDLIATLAERSESRTQFERLLVFLCFPGRFHYTKSSWYRLASELMSLGIALPVECKLARDAMASDPRWANP